MHSARSQDIHVASARHRRHHRSDPEDLLNTHHWLQRQRLGLPSNEESLVTRWSAHRHRLTGWNSQPRYSVRRHEHEDSDTE